MRYLQEFRRLFVISLTYLLSPLLFVVCFLVWASSKLPHKDDPKAFNRFMSNFRFGYGNFVWKFGFLLNKLSGVK